MYTLKICNNFNFVMNMNVATQRYLHKYGIKPSIQRLAIMEYLLVHHVHPTVDDIYNALYQSIPTLSRTTVYNTLKLFIEQKAVNALMIDEKNVRYDIDTSCHAHFQCCRCGKVFDVPIEDKHLLKVTSLGEMMVTECHLYYKGYCRDCKNKTLGLTPKNNINQ